MNRVTCDLICPLIFCYKWSTVSHWLSLASTKDKGEQYLWAVTILKPARWMEIRFLGNATSWGQSSTFAASTTIYIVSCLHEDRALIYKCDNLIYMGLFQFFFFHLVLDLKCIAVVSFYVICLKLQSGLFKPIFPMNTRTNKWPMLPWHETKTKKNKSRH